MNTTLQIIFIATSIGLWVMVTLYWVISSKPDSTGHRGSEIFSFIKLGGSALAIYLPLLTGGYIAALIFQPGFVSGIVGLILCIAGIATMVWARVHLGKNWSGNVVLQQGHQLIKHGPYKYVRHPIYSGGLLAMLGSAIILGMIFGFGWVLFCALGLVRKMYLEEDLLQTQFPAEYAEYREQSRMFIPFIW